MDFYFSTPEKVEKAELMDLAAVMQDVVVDEQWPWLEGLAVTKEIKKDIFDHLCVVTGRLLDATMDPSKLNELLGLEP